MRSIKDRLPAYWPSLVLVVVGFLCFLVNTTLAVAVIAGGIGHALSTYQAHRAELRRATAEQLADRRREEDGERVGLDEVRRLLIMVDRSIGTPSPELVASIVNAIIYHHALRLPADMDALAHGLEASGRGGADASRRNLRALIDEVTEARNRIGRSDGR